MNEDLYEIISSAIIEALSNTHTILVAKIVAVSEKTIDCKPVMNRVVDGRSEELTVFPKVPPIFMQGGTSSETWPLAVGDYCLLFVSERCFDNWYNGQDFLAPLDSRVFDYSDCFALVGVNPLASALTIPTLITRVGDMIHTGALEKIGNTVHTGDNTQTGDRTHTGDINHTGNITQIGNITLTGNLTVTGNVSVTGFISADGEITAMASSDAPVKLSQHKHTGNLGAPTSDPI